jgi:hypothetical protein
MITITPNQWATLAEMMGAESEIFCPIIGYIDLYRVSGITKQVVDIKTSSRTEWRTAWALQGLLYCLATGATHFEIHLLTTGKKTPTAHRYVMNTTRERLKWMMETIGNLARQIEALKPDDCIPERPGYWCSWCPECTTCTGNDLSDIPQIG